MFRIHILLRFLTTSPQRYRKGYHRHFQCDSHNLYLNPNPNQDHQVILIPFSNLILIYIFKYDFQNNKKFDNTKS